MITLWKVCQGQRLQNVKVNDFEYKDFYENELLPEGFVPHPSWVQCGIVEEVESKRGGKK